MENTFNFEKDLTLEGIDTLLALYKDKPSMVTMLQGLKKIKLAEVEILKVKAKFEVEILKLAKLPTPPQDTHNILLRWVEVEEAQGVPVKVTIDGKDEMRQPMVKGWKWQASTNHACSVPRGAGNTSTTTQGTKRAIVVKHIAGDTLTLAGYFRNATEACNHLKLAIGGDSAMRVLQRNGYVVSEYTGADFTVTIN